MLSARTSSWNGSCFKSVIFDDEFTRQSTSTAQTIGSQSSNALHRNDQITSICVLCCEKSYSTYKCTARMLVLDYNETEKETDRKSVGSVMSRSCVCMSMKSKR